MCQTHENALNKGFTLIELMIVIAIIAIIAAIAIPNLMDARKGANESAAIAALRALHSAQNVYRELDKDGNGTLDYGNMDKLYDAGLLTIGNYVYDSGLYTSGYRVTVQTGASPPTLFTWLGAAKVQSGEANDAGDRAFFTDETGVIRYTLYVNGSILGPTENATTMSIFPVIGK